MVGARHHLNIRLKLAHILSADFGIDYLTFLIDFGARRGGESNWRADKAVHMLSKKSTHHPCTTVADRRHCGTYPEALS